MSGDKAKRGRAPDLWPTPWRDMPADESDAEKALLHKMARVAAETPVEPSPGAEERVRKGIGTRKTGVRWLPVAVGATLSVVLALVVVLYSMTSTTRGIPRTLLRNITVVRGRATLADARLKAGALPRTMAVGEKLRSSGDTLVAADIAGAGRMIVHSSSLVSLPDERQTSDTLSLFVHRGEVVLHAQPGSDRKIIVTTGDASVLVTGTVFAVSVEGDHTQVSVWRGSVVVSHGSTRKRVEAGQRFSTADRMAALQSVRDLDAEERRLLGIVETGVDKQIVEAGPEPAGLAEPGEDADEPAGAAPKARETPRVRPPARERTKPRSLSEQERRLMALARGTGAGAANALFSLGALRYDILGDADGAVSAWEEYLKRFPGGSFTGEAHLALFDALRAGKRSAEAVEHGRAALERIKDTVRKRELVLGLAEILHLQLGKFENALDLYRQVVGGSDPVADRAGYLIVDCHLKMKSLDKARKALEEYLRRFPSGRYRGQAECALNEEKK